MLSILSNNFLSLSATDLCKIILLYLILDFAILKTSTKLVFFLSVLQSKVLFSKEDEDIHKFIKGCFKLIYSYAKDDFTNGELYSIWHIILFVKPNLYFLPKFLRKWTQK